MEQNLGNIDRLIRLSLGGLCFIILFASHIFSGGVFFTLLAAGGILLFNAFTGFCLVYRIFGLNTRLY